MKKNLEDFIRERVKKPNDTEIEEILGIFCEKKYKKGELFKSPDKIIEALGFLVKGSSRSYFYNQKGEEVTDQVLQEKNFLSDIISVRTNEKTPIIIEFLEESDVLSAPMNEVKGLLERNITFNILIREYLGDRAMELLKRHLMFLTGTAKERYQYLLKTDTSLFKKFPLRFIASMIGVTPTQLSRIRKEKS